ncbi:ABC transporter substrate-binding protein [Natronomonas sp. EA1]|uniref:ABC transporter substrate-binding protein n=1 Tax=Natronomonas sp. EA1 TaxID=3421655 RepID=UPI003EBF6F2C
MYFTRANSLSRRRFLQATGGTAGAVALAGCTGGEDTPTPTEEPTEGGGSTEEPTETSTPAPQKGGTLELINSTITTFDPIKATDTASGRIIQQVFDALMNYPNGETAVVKQLAESYETSDDFTTYTFNLKQGATFHNGKEVTADDIIYSWERLAGSDNSNRVYFILDSLGIKHETDSDGNYVPGSLAVRAPDKYTLEFDLQQAFASTLSMLAYTSFAAIPKGIVGEGANDNPEEHKQFATQNPIGAGAFQFDFWNQGEDAQVVRYDDYHGDVAFLDAVHWAVIEDPNAAYQYVQNKNADAFGIPTSKYNPSLATINRTDDLGREIGTYGPMQNGETVAYARVPEVSTFYFGFNTNNVPKPVRQAVAYATNQKEFADQVFKSRVAPGYHLTPPLIYPGGGNAYRKHAEENYPYGYNTVDLQSAKQVMEDAGYGENNRFQLTFTHYVSDTWNQMAQILRDRLSAAYIDMQIESAEFSTLLQRGRSGNLQAYTLGWIADWPAPDNFLQLIYPPRTDTSQPGPLTYTNWDDRNTAAKRKAKNAYERVTSNRQPTEEAQQIRNEAYVAMEEANWEDVILVNTFHGINEPMHYNDVHIPLHGAMGPSRMMHNHTWKEQ